MSNRARTVPTHAVEPSSKVAPKSLLLVSKGCTGNDSPPSLIVRFTRELTSTRYQLIELYKSHLPGHKGRATAQTGSCIGHLVRDHRWRLRLFGELEGCRADDPLIFTNIFNTKPLSAHKVNPESITATSWPSGTP
jgi:hypothetical protein